MAPSDYHAVIVQKARGLAVKDPANRPFTEASLELNSILVLAVLPTVKQKHAVKTIEVMEWLNQI